MRKVYEKFKSLYDSSGMLIYEEFRDKIFLPDSILYAFVEGRIQQRKIQPPVERWGENNYELIIRLYKGRKYDILEKILLCGGVGIGRRLEVIWKDRADEVFTTARIFKQRERLLNKLFGEE